MSNEEHGQWMPVVEAAERLGITENELRIRLFSGTVQFRRGEDDQVYVFIEDSDLRNAPPPVDSPATTAGAYREPPVAPPTAPEMQPPAGDDDGDTISLEAFAEIKSTYEAAVELLRAEMRRMANQYDQELLRLQALHADEIRRLEEAREQALDRVLTACEGRVEDLTKAHADEIAFLRTLLAERDDDHSAQDELDILRQQRDELLKLMQALTDKLRPDAQHHAIVGASRVRFTVVPDEEDS